MKKNKKKYLEMKQKKIDAKNRENEHRIDYSDCPVRDEPVNRRGIMDSTGMMETALLMSMMMRRKRRPIIPCGEMMNTTGG